jgi:hypothetical protein
MTFGGIAAPGDVVIRLNRPGASPAFVLSVEPGPGQCGCPTLAAASHLAEGFARHSGVDVWVEDAARTLTAVVRFRRQAHLPIAAPSSDSSAVHRAPG